MRFQERVNGQGQSEEPWPARCWCCCSSSTAGSLHNHHYFFHLAIAHLYADSLHYNFLLPSRFQPLSEPASACPLPKTAPIMGTRRIIHCGSHELKPKLNLKLKPELKLKLKFELKV